VSMAVQKVIRLPDIDQSTKASKAAMTWIGTIVNILRWSVGQNDARYSPEPSTKSDFRDDASHLLLGHLTFGQIVAPASFESGNGDTASSHDSSMSIHHTVKLTRGIRAIMVTPDIDQGGTQVRTQEIEVLGR
jgi:hypothetical protein